MVWWAEQTESCYPVFIPLVGGCAHPRIALMHHTAPDGGALVRAVCSGCDASSADFTIDGDAEYAFAVQFLGYVDPPDTDRLPKPYGMRFHLLPPGVPGDRLANILEGL